LKRDSEIYAAALNEIEGEKGNLWTTKITLQNLQERIAILKAQIEPTADHIETAHNLMLGRYHRAYRKYGEAYYEGEYFPETICDIPEDQIKLSEDDKLDIAADPFFNRPNSIDCDPDDLEPVIRNYWRRMVILEALMSTNPDNFRRMTRSEISISNNQAEGFKRPNLTVRRMETDPAPKKDNLPQTGRAFNYYRSMMKPHFWEDPEQISYFQNPIHEAAELLRIKSLYQTNPYEKIELNNWSLKLVEPYEHPGLWKKLAEQHLKNSQALDAIDVDLHQQSYLKYTLENLTAISAGE